MEAGLSGYFDITGTESTAGRVFWAEQYDKTTGKRIVSVTGISVQSKVYGGTWHPGGTVKVNDETVGEMNYVGYVTHTVSVGASDKWMPIEVYADNGVPWPWTSGEIDSNPDGSLSVTISINLDLWRQKDSWHLYIEGSQTIELTKLNLGPVPYVRRNGQWAQAGMYTRRNGAFAPATLHK